jgi:phosphoglycerate dehydrogenase-like enzyme
LYLKPVKECLEPGTSVSEPKTVPEQNTLLILTRDPQRYAREVAALDFCDLQVKAPESPTEINRHIGTCNLILAEPERLAPLIDAAHRLQWVQSTFAGVEALTVAAHRSDYRLTGVKGVHGPLMAEYVIGYILARERNLFSTYENQKIRRWNSQPYQSLRGRILGICGLGSIGREIAGVAGHFGMRIWGFKRTKNTVEGVERIFTPPDFNAFLAQPDYVVITLPLTAATRGLFGDAAFETMKPEAVLINIGRGNIVNEASLIRAMRSRRIRGAVLDVFENEPLPPDSPLWRLPDVLVTPHNAGFSFPEEIVRIFAGNYRRFRENRPLQFEVDFERGY